MFVCDNSQKCKVEFTFSCNIIWKISKYILSLQAIKKGLEQKHSIYVIVLNLPKQNKQ